MAEAWQGIRLTMRSHARYLEPIRLIVRETCDLVELPEERAGEVVLAVQEALANVIRHCYKDNPDLRIDLCLTLSGDRLEIRIDDYGRFVDPARFKGRALEDVRPGGLGVHFMRRVMDVVRYEKNAWGGTALTMVKVLGAAAEGGGPGGAATGAGD